MVDQVRRVVPDIVERSSVVLNGSDPTRLSPTPLPAGPVVLLAGRLTPEKGFDVALRACADVAHDVAGMRVLLAGDGPERGSLRALVDELGLGDAVESCGPVPSDEMGALFARATVVAMPSRYPEPFGLVALEAALAGRPVVASRVGGLPEVVLHGETGVLVPSDDVGALATALRALLRDRARAAALGRAARARAERDFTLGEHTAKLEVLFERLVAEHAHPGA
jgi:glycogen(starch) synthase